MTNVDLSVGQTGRSTRGRTPIWRLAVDGKELDAVVLEAQLMLAKNQHDLATLTLSSETILDTDGFIDQPVYFGFGQSPRIESFYGYIVTVMETTTNANALQFTLLVIGATREMQGGQPRFWRDQTISGALEILVRNSGLGYAGQAHPYRWKALAQTNESDWAAILKYANRLGWDVYNRYGVVLCYDPETIFRLRGAYAQLKGGSEDELNTQDERLILEFDGSDQSDETPDAIGRKMGYFSGQAPVVISQEGRFQRYKFNTDLVIRDRDEANIYETAFDLADSYDTQQASVRLYGEADLYPGMSVDVTTSNYRLWRGRFDGRWLIDSTTHKLDRASFQTQLKLSRPGKAQINSLPYRTFWDFEAKSKPRMYLGPVFRDPADTTPIDPKAATSRWLSTWGDQNSRTSTGGTQ